MSNLCGIGSPVLENKNIHISGVIENFKNIKEVRK